MITPRAVALVGISLLVATLSGCAVEPEARAPELPGPSGALAVVVGGRANMPAVSLAGAAVSARDMAVSQQSAFSVVVADGAPYVAESGVLVVEGDTPAEQQAERRANRHRLDVAVAMARARSPETDLLAALRVAADSVRGQPGHRSIVVVDSGVSTTGPLDFGHPDLLDVVPQEIADHLGTSLHLPSLAGLTVRFVGLGNTVEPQPPLDSVRRVQLEEIWTTIAETAGAAHVEIDRIPAQGRPLEDVPPVSAVPVPLGYRCEGNVLTITGGRLAFWPYTDVFIDPTLAQAALRPVAEQVRDGRLTATVEATGADVRDPAEQVRLSHLQAQAIADMWQEEFDVPAQLLTVVGRGSDFPGRIAERDAEGDFDPVAAETNRRVTVTFSAPVSC